MSRPDDAKAAAPTAGFPTTRWSRVAAAADPAESEALAELCAAYWFPVYAFIRRRGHDPDQALDLTQEYFARLLEKGTVASADPARGRFRTFLMTDCGFFLADRRDHDHALKRGGGRAMLRIDVRDAEGRFMHEPAHDRTPERQFERDWALALINRAFDRLQRDYESSGRAEVFSRLKPLAMGDADAASRASAARALGIADEALRTAIHRLRGRIAAALRAEVAATLDDPEPDAVDAELRGLLAALGA